MASSDPTVRRLQEQLARLKRQAEENYQILHRARARELALLKAEDLPALFDRLVVHLPESFGLAAVTVLLEDPEHEIRHLLRQAGRQPDALADVLFVDRVVDEAPLVARLASPWLGPFIAADHRLLFPAYGDLASIALLPLRWGQRPVGSLNLASQDPTRFTRHHGTEFLAHLGTIASYCLENTANRALLLLRGLTDVLTGWHNRRYLETRLHEEIGRARRESRPLTCLLMDVDHFKRINDTYGHLAGDDVLRGLVQRVGPQVRASDVAARYGGEEFAMLLPDTGIEAGLQLAERIRAAVAMEPFQGAGHRLPVTVSIGAAQFLPDVDRSGGGEELLARADAALYRAKADGRNTVAGDAVAP